MLKKLTTAAAAATIAVTGLVAPASAGILDDIVAGLDKVKCTALQKNLEDAKYIEGTTTTRGQLEEKLKGESIESLRARALLLGNGIDTTLGKAELADVIANSAVKCEIVSEGPLAEGSGLIEGSTKALSTILQGGESGSSDFFESFNAFSSGLS